MIQSETCFTITCDADPECDPWDEGVYHFPTAEEATAWARDNEWMVTPDRIVCPHHAHLADCEATGHQWGGWWDATLEEVVPYRRRSCDHCNTPEYDPPFHELSLLAHAARELKR